MLNTQKLLYILPDVTYIAELLPGKKEHSFAIQTFRQINGEFLNEEEEFLPDNIEKLFSKIEPDTYRLILPDFLFTNTILEVKETSESKVKQYIKDELLPQLGLSKETHEIAAFILTQYNQVTKIQLTAIEKEVLNAIITSANAHHIKIDHLHPLTWTIKSVISLEPSISVIQIGSLLYTSEHYIGVDQCIMSPASEIENVVETIKTLKGAQSSIQTVYLLTNALVEEKLKEAVSQTLPVQQLATYKEDDTQMPSYVKQIIESGMKTLDIPDFSVPSFALPKEPTEVSHSPASVSALKETGDEENNTNAENTTATTITDTPPQLSKPMSLDVFDEELDGDEENEGDISTEVNTPLELPTDVGLAEDELPTPSIPLAAAPTTTVGLPWIHDANFPDRQEPETNSNTQQLSEKSLLDVRPMDSTPADDSHFHDSHDNLSNETDALEQFTAHTPTEISAPLSSVVTKKEHEVPQNNDSEVHTVGFSSSDRLTHTKHEVIKNQNSSNRMLKMAFVTLVVFALTVAVGVGIGFGILSWGNREENIVSSMPSPTPVTITPIIVAPSPVPTPSASSSARVDKTNTSILVVNATTKAGYAGTTTAKLKAAGYTQVTARNAKGEYEEGLYLLTTEENEDLLSALSEASDLTLELSTGKTTEDPSNQFTAIIVLAE